VQLVKVRLFLVMLLILPVTLAATVAPVPGTQSVDMEFEIADLVCNCVVRTIDYAPSDQSKGSIEGPRLMRVKADIHDAYKTNGFTKGVIEIDAEDQTVWKGERVLLFLRSTSSGVYGPPCFWFPHAAINRAASSFAVFKGLDSVLCTANQITHFEPKFGCEIKSKPLRG
jgi:hypothetical protein